MVCNLKINPKVFKLPSLVIHKDGSSDFQTDYSYKDFINHVVYIIQSTDDSTFASAILEIDLTGGLLPESDTNVTYNKNSIVPFTKLDFPTGGTVSFNNSMIVGDIDLSNLNNDAGGNFTKEFLKISNVLEPLEGDLIPTMATPLERLFIESLIEALKDEKYHTVPATVTGEGLGIVPNGFNDIPPVFGTDGFTVDLYNFTPNNLEQLEDNAYQIFTNILGNNYTNNIVINVGEWVYQTPRVELPPSNLFYGIFSTTTGYITYDYSSNIELLLYLFKQLGGLEIFFLPYHNCPNGNVSMNCEVNFSMPLEFPFDFQKSLFVEAINDTYLIFQDKLNEFIDTKGKEQLLISLIESETSWYDKIKNGINLSGFLNNTGSLDDIDIDIVNDNGWDDLKDMLGSFVDDNNCSD